jgi:hypothetical protein
MYTIELHASISSTQKLKLSQAAYVEYWSGKGGQLTCTPTLPLTCRIRGILEWEGWTTHLYSNTPPHVRAPPGRMRGILEWVVIILINAPARIRTRDLWLWYHIELHAPTSSTQKLKLIGNDGQFTYTPTHTKQVKTICNLKY